MKIPAFIILALVLMALVFWPGCPVCLRAFDGGEATFTIPNLHGPDIVLKESECSKVTPLGWALAFDFYIGTDKQEQTEKLFKKACQENPALLNDTAKWLSTKDRLSVKRK